MPEAEPPDEIAFQKRTWQVERMGWIAMATLLAAALTGALGDGPLAEARIEDPAATIRYERVLRLGRESGWEIAATPGQAARITLSGAAMRGLRPLGLMPPGAEVVLTREAIAVALAPEARGAVASLRLEPREAGLLTGTLAVNGRLHPIRLLVLP